MMSLSKKLTVFIIALSQSACLFSSSMHMDRKLLSETSEQPLVLAVTHVILGKDKEENKKFWHGTHQVLDSLSTHHGYLGHKVRRSVSGREAWTLTLWQDKASLRAFVKSTVHDDATREGMFAVSRAHSFNLKTTSSALQTDWRSIEVLMDEYGRSMY